MNCIAHRGFADEHPENTLPAVRAAATVADAIEVDVRRCGSGELVVVHDATIDRVTDDSGRVAARSAAELADLSVCGSGAGVPTLAEVCAELPSEVTLNVELKERGLVADLEPSLAGFDGDVLVSSFLDGPLRNLERRDAALLFGGDETDEGGGDANAEAMLDRAVALGCVAVHPHYATCTPSLVRRAHERGLTVNAWTVPDPATAGELAAAGVDGVIVDSPAICERCR